MTSSLLTNNNVSSVVNTNEERNIVHIRRYMSTPELRSLEHAVPAMEVVIGTPAVEARPVEIDYFCCCCSRVKEPPLFFL